MLNATSKETALYVAVVQDLKATLTSDAIPSNADLMEIVHWINNVELIDVLTHVFLVTHVVRTLNV